MEAPDHIAQIRDLVEGNSNLRKKVEKLEAEISNHGIFHYHLSSLNQRIEMELKTSQREVETLRHKFENLIVEHKRVLEENDSLAAQLRAREREEQHQMDVLLKRFNHVEEEFKHCREIQHSFTAQGI